MDRLPLELLHVLCASLPREDVLSFRLVSRECAAVGIEHMLPDVPIAFLPESFARLKAISEHPIISQHVKTILYQADTLPEIYDFETYKREARLPRRRDLDIPSPPPPSASERSRRAYTRKVKAIGGPHHIPKRQLREGWNRYQQLQEEIEEFQNTDDDLKILQAAIARFPRLSTIVMATQYQYPKEYYWLRIEAPFTRCLLQARQPDAEYEYCGVRPLRALLLSAYAANTNLHKLWVGRVSWKFFDGKQEQLARTNGSLNGLRELCLEIGTYGYEETDEASWEDMWRMCKEFFAKRRVLDFLTSAPNLEIMEVVFGSMMIPSESFYAISLNDIVGVHTWSRLRSLCLKCIEAEEVALLDFFGRHSRTLKRVELEDFHLTGQDSSWLSVFGQISRMPNLVYIALYGHFTSEVQDEHIYMDEPYPGRADTPLDRSKTRGWALCNILRDKVSTLPLGVTSEELLKLVLFKKFLY